MLISLNKYQKGVAINPQSISSIKVSKGRVVITMNGGESFNLLLAGQELRDFLSNYLTNVEVDNIMSKLII